MLGGMRKDVAASVGEKGKKKMEEHPFSPVKGPIFGGEQKNVKNFPSQGKLSAT